jgi:fatty-acyl-CoA synthase
LLIEAMTTDSDTVDDCVNTKGRGYLPDAAVSHSAATTGNTAEDISGGLLHPDAIVEFPAPNGGDYISIKISEILPTIGSVAAVLRSRLNQNGVVILALGNGAPLVCMIFACIYAGIEFAIINPSDPLLVSQIDGLHLFGATKTIGLVVTEQGAHISPHSGMISVTSQYLFDRANSSKPIYPIRHGEDGIVYYQLTSGTTGKKKSVPVTKKMLLSNINDMLDRMELTNFSRFLIWIPMSHDMGLITFLVSIRAGANILVLGTDEFIRNPLSWLRHATRHRSTLTSVPPSALRLTARLGGTRSRDIDLRHLRRIVVGAEPIFEHVLAKFNSIFCPLGLPSSSVRPSYGMAEAVVCVSTAKTAEPLRIVHAGERTTRVGERIAPCAQPLPAGASYVSNGRPLGSVRVDVWDDGDRRLPELTVGRLMVAGTSVADAYAGYPSDLTHGWRDTGDIGFVCDDEVYVIDRRKDIIIRGGVNFSCAEIEDFVLSVGGSALRRVAAFSTVDFGVEQERLFILCEARDFGPDDRERVVAAVTGTLKIAPDFVLAVLPGTIPLTTSGKIMRQALRDRYAGYSYDGA